MADRYKLVAFLALATFCLLVESQPKTVNDATTPWVKKATKDISSRLQAWKGIKKHKAKNLILVIGDGMGIATVSAARALKANLLGSLAGDETLFMENLPFSGYSKTYSADYTVTDSAASATAYWCGVKVNQDTVGVDSNVLFAKSGTHKNESNLKCMSHYAAEGKKSIGVVTTVTVTHASPSPSYAHSASRNWETDWNMTVEDRRAGFKDIALQFLEIGQHIDVLMGAGRSYFDARNDTRNLTREWLQQRGRSPSRKPMYVETRDQMFEAVRNGATDILGLFTDNDSLLYSAQPRSGSTEPTLAEMVDATIRILRTNPNGFLLFIEGGKIDWGHHDNIAALALHDTIAMDAAVKTAYEMTSSEETLMVVTADHSHVFTFGGYPTRNRNILSVNDRLARDNKSYTYLAYGNGPGFAIDATGRKNVRANDTQSIWYEQQSAVPLKYDTHGGEDVPIYASGPQSHLFTGVIEQHTIPHLMMYAACIGPARGFECPPERSGASSAFTLTSTFFPTGRLLTVHFLSLFLLLLPALRTSF